MNKKFSIISLGCPRNLVDSEKIIGEFKRKGYSYTDKTEGLHTLIINTCGFIDDAKRESIDVILKALEAKAEGSVERVIVAGCLSQRYPSALKAEFPEIDKIRGVLNIRKKPSLRSVLRLTPPHYAYIKISEGCLNRCSYCVIPYIKGPYRSRPMGSILKEALMLIEKGVKEIILVGQDTSLYGIDIYKKKMLAELIRRLDKISGDNWIRLLYVHPANLSSDIIKAIKDSGHTCRYIDLPIEHISDKILRMMKRRTTKKGITSLIDYIRKEIPGAVIRTSLIVGFPGEGVRDFKELCRFIEEMKIERLGVFRYSREEGTPAYGYKGQVSDREKDRRCEEVMALQQQVSEDVNRRFMGKMLKVLVDSEEGRFYLGRTEHDAPEVDGCVFVRHVKNVKAGNFYNVRIDRTHEYDLEGEFVDLEKGFA